jgi:hypothetical protein
MKRIIKYYEDIALSNFDIFDLLNGKVNIELYPNLHNYDNLDQLLGKYGICVLLFEAKPSYGHWVCLLKLNNMEVEFFNPYGGFPDDSLLQINQEFRKKSDQEYPLLSELLLNSPYKLTYNEYQFQEIKSDIKTCGRHCSVRLMCQELSLYQYVKFLDKLCKKFDTNYDGMVTLLTIKNL